MVITEELLSADNISRNEIYVAYTMQNPLRSAYKKYKGKKHTPNNNAIF
jgi:hypothetical protein